MKTKSTNAKKFYGVVFDHDHLPELTVTQEDIDKTHDETFGTDDDPKAVSLMALIDSLWARTCEEFYRQRIVYVQSNETMLLRFRYDYEVDLDRIKNETELLRWVRHLGGKTWMTTRRINQFIDAVADIKHFKARL